MIEEASQIYIRYNITYSSGVPLNNPIIHKYKSLIARYFTNGNYGEQLVSRARYILEELKTDFINSKSNFNDTEKLETLKRFCDIDFDTKYIICSLNLIEEAKCFGEDSIYLFNRASEGGQLYIDITDTGVKYCFMKSYNQENPMNAEQYMQWRYHPDWHTPSKYINAKTIKYIEKNIKKINNIATLMTPEEVHSFINNDYSYLFTDF